MRAVDKLLHSGASAISRVVPNLMIMRSSSSWRAYFVGRCYKLFDELNTAESRCDDIKKEIQSSYLKTCEIYDDETPLGVKGIACQTDTYDEVDHYQTETKQPDIKLKIALVSKRKRGRPVKAQQKKGTVSAENAPVRIRTFSYRLSTCFSFVSHSSSYSQNVSDENENENENGDGGSDHNNDRPKTKKEKPVKKDTIYENIEDLEDIALEVRRTRSNAKGCYSIRVFFITSHSHVRVLLRAIGEHFCYDANVAVRRCQL